MVRQLSCSVKVDLILSIPLSLRLPINRIVCSGTKNGKFLSAVHIIVLGRWGATTGGKL